MAAEVSWSNSEIPMTRDLLGQLSNISTSNLLDLFPSHHSQTQIVYEKRCCSNSLNSPDTSDVNSYNWKGSSASSSSSSSHSQEEETSLPLELKLPLPNSSHYSPTVCTSLDKVKAALERAAVAHKQANNHINAKKPEEEDKINGCRQLKRNYLSSSTSGMFATRCPSCFMYVITLKTNPICPRCNFTIPLDVIIIAKTKKPWIDLNQSLS